MVKVFIVGPTSELAACDIAAIRAVAGRLRTAGCEPVAPAESDGRAGHESRERDLRRDIRQLLACDAIAVLPGWKGSRGGRLLGVATK